jgi:iron complex outermembrane receptor protein
MLKTKYLSTVAMAITMGATLGVHAPAAFAADEEASSAGLEEIVVTARKRSENLQTVGTSVSALGKVQLDRRFDTDLRDFANAAPNVVIDDLQQGPGSPAAISIRGIGTTDVEKSFDPTVGVVVDGVFIGANSGAMLKAIDIERVEVLRGPQGTLFGRNSIAGVINVTRSEPYFDFGGRIRAGYGNYNDVQLDGYVNVPVIKDKIAIKIGGAKREHDGYFFDATTNKQVGHEDYRSVDASILIKPFENFKLVYRFERAKQDQDTNVLLNMAQPGQVWCDYLAQCAQSTTVPQSGPNRYVVLGDGAPAPATFKSTLHIVNATWEFAPDYKLDYVFGRFTTAETAYQDWDATPLLLYHTDRPAKYKQNSHELRLTHQGSGPLSFVLGGYYWESSYRIDLLSYVGITVPQTAEQTTKSYAAFFEGDYKVTDKFTLTLGGRYTHDKKTAGLDDPFISETVTPPLIPRVGLHNLANPSEASWSQFTPKASVKYQINDDAMVYALFSSGFRSGGYSGRPSTIYAATTAYNPEKVKNFEVGFKTEFLDRRLRLNGSAFLMKYTDKQEELNVPVVCSNCTGQETRVLNASKAEIKGIEIDMTAKVAEGLIISGNLGLLDAKYTSFPGTTPTFTGPDVINNDLHLRRSPKVTGSISASYEREMLGGKGWVEGTWHYIASEDLTFANSPQGHNGSQNIVNASVNFKINQTTFSVYGKNLTKNDAWSQAYDVANLWTYTAVVNPRTYGMRILQDF